MVDTISDRWNQLKTSLRNLPAFVRRTHRFVAALWLLSFAVSLVVSAAGEELPGPSIPALSFIAVVLTGGYLLLRPWVRGPTTASERWQRLRRWDVSRSVFIRRTHRIVAALWLGFLGLALAVELAGGPESQLVLVPIVALLAYLAITGGYMLLEPWVNRFRTR